MRRLAFVMNRLAEEEKIGDLMTLDYIAETTNTQDIQDIVTNKATKGRDGTTRAISTQDIAPDCELQNPNTLFNMPEPKNSKQAQIKNMLRLASRNFLLLVEKLESISDQNFGKLTRHASEVGNPSTQVPREIAQDLRRAYTGFERSIVEVLDERTDNFTRAKGLLESLDHALQRASDLITNTKYWSIKDPFEYVKNAGNCKRNLDFFRQLLENFEGPRENIPKQKGESIQKIEELKQDTDAFVYGLENKMVSKQSPYSSK